MEEEIVITGYCRAIDQSRMVVAESENGRIFADCAYPDCPHAPVCQIAAAISEKLK